MKRLKDSGREITGQEFATRGCWSYLGKKSLATMRDHLSSDVSARKDNGYIFFNVRTTLKALSKQTSTYV